MCKITVQVSNFHFIYVEVMTFGFEFTSGRSHYRKMIDSTGRDYMYWNDLCEGEIFIVTNLVQNVICQSISTKNNLVVSNFSFKLFH